MFLEHFYLFLIIKRSKFFTVEKETFGFKNKKTPTLLKLEMHILKMLIIFYIFLTFQRCNPSLKGSLLLWFS